MAQVETDHVYCLASPMQLAEKKVPWRGATVLVIEDERFVREVTCEILREAGYRVLQAESASGAKTVFRRHGNRIQLLLCDAVLPDSSGALLAQALRRRSAGLKVILVSGYPSARLAGYFDAESGAEFMAKPYSATALIAKMQMVLQKQGS